MVSSGAKVKLDELSKILGFAGKPTDIDGSQVEAFFRAGRIAEIAAYCETDVVGARIVALVVLTPSTPSLPEGTMR